MRMRMEFVRLGNGGERTLLVARVEEGRGAHHLGGEDGALGRHPRPSGRRPPGGLGFEAEGAAAEQQSLAGAGRMAVHAGDGEEASGGACIEEASRNLIRKGVVTLVGTGLGVVAGALRDLCQTHPPSPSPSPSPAQLFLFLFSLVYIFTSVVSLPIVPLRYQKRTVSYDLFS